MNEKELIKIASGTMFYGLAKKHAKKITCKNRICGDEIVIGIDPNKNQIAFECKACILTQASASILAKNYKKLDKENIGKYTKSIENFFQNKTELPKEISEFDKILVDKNKNRKECIVLPFNTLEKIIND